MKIIILFICFLITYAYEKVEYNLTEGKETFVGYFEKDKFYEFYIPATYNKIVGISITWTFLNDFFQSNFYSFINEYSNRDDRHEILSENLMIESIKRNNKYSYFKLYEVSSSSTNYIALEYYPDTFISSVRIKMEIFSGVYDLKNGIPNFANLKSKETYCFYAEVTEGLQSEFTLAMNYTNSTPLSNVTIFEYESKDSIYTKARFTAISLTQKDNKLISTFSYTASSNLIKYISIRIKPIYDIYYLTINSEIEIFDLSNSNPQTIYNLISGKVYFFYIKVTQYSKVDISLIHTNSSNKPLNNINVYEYENKDSFASYHRNISKAITISTDLNQYVISFSHYIGLYTTKYIAFLIKPLFNIDYLISNYEIFGGSYEMSSMKTIENLKSKNDYNLFITAKQFQMVNIELIMNYMNNIPFSNVIISEISQRDKNDYHRCTTPITMTNESNQLITSFSYLLNESYSSKYLRIKITPSYDIDYMTAYARIIDSLIELKINSVKRAYNLKSGIIYYFTVKNLYNNEVNLKLTMENMINYPFSQVTIYESWGYFSPNAKSVIINNLNFTKNTNRQEVSIKYKTTLDARAEIYIKIEPIYDINYIDTEVDVKDIIPSSSSNNSKNIVIIIVSSIISIIFILILIFVIIYIVKKRKNKINDENVIQSFVPYTQNNSQQRHLVFPKQNYQQPSNYQHYFQFQPQQYN